jgi:hypothetical protein
MVVASQQMGIVAMNAPITAVFWNTLEAPFKANGQLMVSFSHPHEPCAMRLEPCTLPS